MESNFFHLLYTESNVPDLLDKYCAPLLYSSNPLTREKAKRLLKYWGLLTDTAFINKRMLTLFTELEKALEREFPDVSYELSARIKALLSALNKLNEIEEHTLKEFMATFIRKKFFGTKLNCTEDSKFIQDKINEINCTEDAPLKKEFLKFLRRQNVKKNNPFNRVKDFFAVRIILEDDCTITGVDALYKMTNFILDFIVENSTFELVPSDPLIQIGTVSTESPLIVVPEKSGLKEKYVKFCKDYVFKPKKDGYQSIHFVIYDPYTDRYCEIQIRTRSMHIISETLANHDQYKKIRYGDQQAAMGEVLDLSKINMMGFRYFKYQDPYTGKEKEYISDTAGVIKSIPIRLEFERPPYNSIFAGKK